jgi:hypothetical protein
LWGLFLRREFAAVRLESSPVIPANPNYVAETGAFGVFIHSCDLIHISLLTRRAVSWMARTVGP